MKFYIRKYKFGVYLLTVALILLSSWTLFYPDSAQYNPDEKVYMLLTKDKNMITIEKDEDKNPKVVILQTLDPLDGLDFRRNQDLYLRIAIDGKTEIERPIAQNVVKRRKYKVARYDSLIYKNFETLDISIISHQRDSLPYFRIRAGIVLRVDKPLKKKE